MTVDNGFDTLFRVVYPQLVSLGVSMTGRRDVADELAQETMLRAHDRWDELATFEAPDAWCRRVMRNLLIDHLRSRDAERRAVDRLAGAPVERPTTPALHRWWQLVGPLPERQRTIVTLYYAEDLSVGEIARELATTQAAVKASLFKARRSIQRRLDVERDEPDARRHGEDDDG